MVKTIVIPGSEIGDGASFHAVFAAALGFPDFYGRNLDAFNDCLRSAAVPGDGMMGEAVEPGDSLRLVVGASDRFRERCPDLYTHLVEIVNRVNREYEQRGETAPIVLVFEPA